MPGLRDNSEGEVKDDFPGLPWESPGVTVSLPQALGQEG